MCLSYRYDLPQGCGGKLPGAVLRPLGVLWWVVNILAVESTKLEINVQNHYYTLGEDLY